MVMIVVRSVARGYSKWKKTVRQQKAKLYIMRACIWMLLSWDKDSRDCGLRHPYIVDGFLLGEIRASFSSEETRGNLSYINFYQVTGQSHVPGDGDAIEESVAGSVQSSDLEAVLVARQGTVDEAVHCVEVRSQSYVP
ncbi:hypothetical protein MLD38_036143 [Melastoma candidum]|uniref:Uncharacterized protein n=1 Tax=Melastoma candidum TaxID=119954 RepID=A0ACB9LJ20_9MYRT|nr:hypothetical protein MLD38_036143 [Melastoma candidum]